MTESENALGQEEGRPRIKAVVALALLEAIRTQDRPPEILEDENVTITMPRRLGLSDVVEAQIRRYREEARRRHRISDDEARDLMRLVVRRPDSDDVLRQVGQRLAEDMTEGRQWSRVLPRRAAHLVARRRIRRELRSLFGRPVGRLLPGLFAMEVVTDLFMEGDPGGDACEIVSGFSAVILERSTGMSSPVHHPECRGRGGGTCRWSLARPER